MRQYQSQPALRDLSTPTVFGQTRVGQQSPYVTELETRPGMVMPQNSQDSGVDAAGVSVMGSKKSNTSQESREMLGGRWYFNSRGERVRVATLPEELESEHEPGEDTARSEGTGNEELSVDNQDKSTLPEDLSADNQDLSTIPEEEPSWMYTSRTNVRIQRDVTMRQLVGSPVESRDDALERIGYELNRLMATDFDENTLSSTLSLQAELVKIQAEMRAAFEHSLPEGMSRDGLARSLSPRRPYSHEAVWPRDSGDQEEYHDRVQQHEDSDLEGGADRFTRQRDDDDGSDRGDTMSIQEGGGSELNHEENRDAQKQAWCREVRDSSNESSLIDLDAAIYRPVPTSAPTDNRDVRARRTSDAERAGPPSRLPPSPPVARMQTILGSPASAHHTTAPAAVGVVSDRSSEIPNGEDPVRSSNMRRIIQENAVIQEGRRAEAEAHRAAVLGRTENTSDTESVPSTAIPPSRAAQDLPSSSIRSGFPAGLKKMASSFNLFSSTQAKAAPILPPSTIGAQALEPGTLQSSATGERTVPRPRHVPLITHRDHLHEENPISDAQHGYVGPTPDGATSPDYVQPSLPSSAAIDNRADGIYQLQGRSTDPLPPRGRDITESRPSTPRLESSNALNDVATGKWGISGSRALRTGLGLFNAERTRVVTPRPFRGEPLPTAQQASGNGRRQNYGRMAEEPRDARPIVAAVKPGSVNNRIQALNQANRSVTEPMTQRPFVRTPGSRVVTPVERGRKVTPRPLPVPPTRAAQQVRQNAQPANALNNTRQGAGSDSGSNYSNDDPVGDDGRSMYRARGGAEAGVDYRDFINDLYPDRFA